MKFVPHNPEQGYLLPPSVKEVLGEDHLCFFVHRIVEELDLRTLEAEYVEEGRVGYAPALLLKVWLYAYALQVTTSRRLEQRVKEGLGFRYLASGAQPDRWTLNALRTRHRRSIKDLFLQGVELARRLGTGRLGHVAIDSALAAARRGGFGRGTPVRKFERLTFRSPQFSAGFGNWNGWKRSGFTWTKS